MSEKEELGQTVRPKRDDAKVAAKYDEFKEWGGRKYTGMKVGGRHKWIYDSGEWRERKVAPDDWEFQYAVTKRRKGKAPEGSGAPVGTEYHWYIIGHQFVKKLDANSYSTNLEGLKVKIAHKRADRGAWSRGEKAQMRSVLKTLERAAANLREEIGMEAAEAPRTAKQKRLGEQASEAPLTVSRKRVAKRVKQEAPQRSRRTAAGRR